MQSYVTMWVTERSRGFGLVPWAVSLGLHGAVLGVIFVRALGSPPAPWGAGVWEGRTFEVSTLSEEPFQTPEAATNSRGAAGANEPNEHTADGKAPPTSPEPTKAPEVEPNEAEPATGPTAKVAAAPPEAQPAAQPAAQPDKSKPARAQSPLASTRASSAPPANVTVDKGVSSKSTSASPSPEHAAGAAASNGTTSAAPGGVVGADGVTARRGNLPDAFTRALPAAARGQIEWRTLPLGSAGQVVVVVRLDDAGAVSEVTPLGVVPAHLEQLLRTTRLLLKAGQFAPPASGASGEYRLGLRAAVEQREASSDEHALPDQVRHLASRYPTQVRPGEATVTFNSGRTARFEVVLDPERHPDW